MSRPSVRPRIAAVRARKSPAGVPAGPRVFGVRHTVGGDDGGHEQCVWPFPCSRISTKLCDFCHIQTFFLVWTYCHMDFGSISISAREPVSLQTPGGASWGCWSTAPPCDNGLPERAGWPIGRPFGTAAISASKGAWRAVAPTRISGRACRSLPVRAPIAPAPPGTR